jgi:S1-C subfamily serine protease
MASSADSTALTALSDALAALVAGVAPHVVAVRSHRSLASGFVWKPGLVVTADEALAEEGDVAVTLASGERLPASIVGRDPTTDVALLRFKRSDLPPVALVAVPAEVGRLAVVVGSRDGAPVAALGTVAAAGPAWRSMRGGDIDARLELGVSLRGHAEGGLALDAAGRALGMAVFGPRRRVLVIPTATIARVAGQLEALGRVPRGYLGLGLQPVRLDGGERRAAMVMSVDPDGPGAAAGFHQGDVIVSWNGEPLAGLGRLLRALGPASVGQAVQLTLRRGGKTEDLRLVIGERPAH